MPSFEAYFKKTLGYEGGYKLVVDNGDTSYAGIRRLLAPHWSGWIYTDLGQKPPKALIEEYYHVDIWLPLWCYLIENDDIGWQMFDFAVTSGLKSSVELAQSSVECNVTGKMNPDTICAINLRDPEEFLYKFCYGRMKRYARKMNGSRIVTFFERTFP